MSDKRDDGGRAFPGQGETFIKDPHGGVVPQSAYGMQGEEGMSLRDWFAGQALSMADARNGPPSEIAKWAYAVADAMIEARKS